MSETAEFDVAVVGGGIVGSWTAFHLARAKKNVVLLEQFEARHCRGSSHGQSRLTRAAYAERCFASLMPRAHQLWQRMERDSGAELMVQCGTLTIATTDEGMEDFENSLRNLEEFAKDAVEKDSDRIRELLWRQLRFPDLKGIFMDKTGGALLARNALSTVQDMFRKEGGQLWDQRPVTDVRPEGPKVRLQTSRGDVVAAAVVICGGAWTSRLLAPKFVPSLPFEPQVVRVYYWKEKEAGAYTPAAGFPGLLDMRKDSIYAIPSIEYPGFVKVCAHGGIKCDPDHRDDTPQDPRLLQTLTDYVRQHFPLLEPEPAIVETCMYTVTPDELFVVDTLPNHKNIVIGTGFSGTGFKTSPVVGEILSQLALGEEPGFDISEFKLTRFL